MKEGSFLKEVKTDRCNNLHDLSMHGPVLLIFLRHFGCMFCRAALKEIVANREGWESKGVKIIIGHLSDEKTAKKFFDDYGLNGIESISDPICSVYQKFDLLKGSFNQLMGLQTWMSGFKLIASGTIPGMTNMGDGFQMPGVFLLKNGEIMASYRHKYVSDKPDYDKLIAACIN